MKYFGLILFPLFFLGGCCKKPTYKKVENDSSSKEIKEVITVGIGASDLRNEEIALLFNDSSITPITKNRFMDRNPILSYDDASVLFIRREMDNSRVIDSNSETSLIIINLLEKKEEVLVDSIRDLGGISWSPNALSFCFTSRTEEEWILWIYDVDNRLKKRAIVGANSFPSWSPNGEQIAFYSDNNELQVYELKTENVITVAKNVGDARGIFWTNGNDLGFANESGGWNLLTDNLKKIEHTTERRDFLDQSKLGWAEKLQKIGASNVKKK